MIGTKTPEYLRDRLTDALMHRDKPLLEKLINECVALGFPELEPLIEMARKVLESMEYDDEGEKYFMYDVLIVTE